MLKENWRTISRIERMADALICILSFYFSYYFRDFLTLINKYFPESTIPYKELAPIQEYFLILLVALITQTLALNLFRAYSSMRLRTYWSLLRTFILSSTLIFVTIVVVLFLFKIEISRSFIAIFCTSLTCFLSIERVIVLKLLRYYRSKGFNYRNIIICGLNHQSLHLISEIHKRPELGIRIRAFANLNDDLLDSGRESITFRDELKKQNLPYRRRIIQGIMGLKSALTKNAIDEIIFTDLSCSLPKVEEVMLAATEQGVRTSIAADFFSIGLTKSAISNFGSIPLIHFQPPPGDRWELVVKRLIDIIIAGLLLLILSPLFAVIAILIKLSSPGPVLFVQKRVGLNGHLFNMLKFRSMKLNAEQELAKLKSANEMTGPVFKLTNDPRVTGIGKFLRKHSLDELPQFWNVFTGEMSLVGPRPPIPNEVNTYTRNYRRRLSMRPGLTCTWQVSGRNDIKNFENWVKLDLEYIDNWSLWRDIWLVFRTIPAVLFGKGAR